MSKVGDQFKTGQVCDTSGVYSFDGYMKPSATDKQPTQEERVITMVSGRPFPPINSTDKGAYWNLLRAT